MTDERADLIALSDAVEQYGVGYSTLGLWIREGRLPAFKFARDRKTYIRRQDLKALLQAERPGRPGGWRRQPGDEGRQGKVLAV